MTRVLALEPTTKDIGQANEYGEVVYLFPGSRPSIWETSDYLQAVQQRLEEIGFSKEDYFLAAGPTVPLMTVITLLSNIYPEFRVLFWHATAHTYVPRTFNHKDYENVATG